MQRVRFETNNVNLLNKQTMKIGKLSFGIGDRFGHQAVAQLKAIAKAKQAGVDVTPVWNKSNREHSIIHTTPADTWNAVNDAVKEFGWNDPFFVDADHINISNVDKFIDSSNFFTIDVADFIGKSADESDVAATVARNLKYCGKEILLSADHKVLVTEADIQSIAKKYLFAIQEAGRIYRHIEKAKGADNFVTEVSMDEVNSPQTPVEMLFILSMLAHEGIPAQTIAPRFSGRFNKGVDYVGDVVAFESEFEFLLLVIEFAVQEFGLPSNLKLSVHSGSDKFSIYPAIQRMLKKYNKGIHVKTAGTNWLEEVIGLALAGDAPLKLAKTIYTEALARMDELCKPYAEVINIKADELPTAEVVNGWSCEQFVNALRHIPNHPEYNPNLRQLIHVGYKIAVEHSEEYYATLEAYPEIIGEQVTTNLFDRHILRLFDCKPIV
ncbi:MAG: tagaturonate epimerase family protein [Bacteroidales bacterium]|nr:tagaturonate epimerase family protein [Bacteroidales bacterium]